MSAQLFGQSLAAHGVRQVFTLVGTQINPLLAGCADAGLRLIDTRHEATAGHAAEGYAKASSHTGVCLVSAGPGFTNALTALASCYADATPTLFVAGGPPLLASEPNPLQGGYSQIEVARPLAKWVARADAPQRIPALLAEALATAREGRPGPVFVEIPADIAHRQAPQALPAAQPLPAGPPPPPDPTIIEEIIARLKHAQRPLILAGGGIKYGGAATELRRFAQLTGVPVLTNFDAHGALAASDPAWGGPFSMVLPEPLGQPADLLLVLGARFGLLTGGLPGHCGDARTRIIQVDIHAPELAHLRATDLGIVGDCRRILAALNEALDGAPPPSRQAWQQALRTARATCLAGWARESAHGALHPFEVGRTVAATLPPDSVLVADGGDAKAWIEMNIAPQHLGRYVSRAYHGTLGSGQGLALGAQIAAPDARVCLFIGDGAWGFHLQEIDTFMRHGLPIVTVVLNNGCWGSTRHAQQQLWQGARQLATDLGHTRYDRIAAGFGCPAERVTEAAALAPALRRALEHDGPSLIDVLVDPAPDPARRLVSKRQDVTLLG